MSSPYWGVLPPITAKKDFTTQYDRNRLVMHAKDFHSPSSIDWQAKPDRISVQSEKSDAATFSTLSVAPSDLQGGGLAPRPPSFPYGSTEYDRNFFEKRRQRRVNKQSKIPGDIYIQPISGPVEEPLRSSKSSQHHNGRESVHSGATWPKSNKKSRGTIIEKGQNQTLIYSKRRNVKELEEHDHTTKTAIGNGSELKPVERLPRLNLNDLNTRKLKYDESIQYQEFTQDRSPLQKLEMALDSLAKDSRVRATNAELSPKDASDTQNNEKLPQRLESGSGIKIQISPKQKITVDMREQDYASSPVEERRTRTSNLSVVSKPNNKLQQMSAELPQRSNDKNDIENKTLTTEDYIPRSVSLNGFSSRKHVNILKSARLDDKLDTKKVNGGSISRRESEIDTQSSETTTKFSSRSSQNTGSYGNHQSPKESLTTPESSLSQHHRAQLNSYRPSNSKPTRERTLRKITRLASEKLSMRGLQDKTKPTGEKKLSRAERPESKNPHTSGSENLRPSTNPPVDLEEKPLSSPIFYENERLSAADVYVSSQRLDEWKNGGVAQLSGIYLDVDIDDPNVNLERERTWRESASENGGRNINKLRRAEAYIGEYDNIAAPTRFKPPLFLKCGPMLRYCGLRREVPRNGHSSTNQEREIWRGTVMIVCQDSVSSYELAPTLRLFWQPIELLPPPPMRLDGLELAPEYIDPIAGLSRLGRDGRTLYVRPIEEIDVEKDLSREESSSGLYDMNQTQLDDTPALRLVSQKLNYDGEKANKYKEVRGFRLHSEQGMTFWRFNIEIELKEKQQRIAYRINRGPAIGFWVPPRGQAMNITYYNCNSFSCDVNPDHLCGPDPMWRDILNTHQTQPFHVMIGGGNQVYNDDLIHVSPLLKEWYERPDSLNKIRQPFSSQFQQELEAFYLNRYCMWFSQGLFGLAVSQIPMVNMFADHDIINDFRSHDDQYMRSPVISGIAAVAFKYYMLFQHQSSIDEGEENEPSWILGVRPGPYIEELSRTIFTRLGRTVAFLGLDCCTERTLDEILTSETCQKIFARLNKEIIYGDTKHLLVLLTTPQSYLQSAWTERRKSKMLQPIKGFGRKVSLRKHLNRSKEQTQNEVDDYNSIRKMRDERRRILQGLQDLAAAKSVRITFLGGNVKMGAVGLLYSNLKLGIPKERDFRYMPTIISSAIVDAPIPDTLAEYIKKKIKVHHIDNVTDEDIIPVFTYDVDGKQRENQLLLNRRNWTLIRQNNFSSSYTWNSFDEETVTLAPQRTSSLIRRMSDSFDSRRFVNTLSRNTQYHTRSDVSRPPLSNSKFFNEGNAKKFSGSAPVSRQNSLNFDKESNHKRTLSLTRKDFNSVGLFRLSSERRTRREEPFGYESNPENELPYKSKKWGNKRLLCEDDIHNFPILPKPVDKTREKATEISGTLSPTLQNNINSPNILTRNTTTSTSLSQKQTQKDKNFFRSNFKDSLDIVINMEINPKDPAGATMPYRLLVPALFCDNTKYF